MDELLNTSVLQFFISLGYNDWSVNYESLIIKNLPSLVLVGDAYDNVV